MSVILILTPVYKFRRIDPVVVPEPSQSLIQNFRGNTYTVMYLEDNDKATLDVLENKTRIFYSRVMKNSGKLYVLVARRPEIHDNPRFAKADKSDGFKDVSQEENLVEILKGSCETSKDILVQFKISDAMSQVTDDVHGPTAPNCEELFSQPNDSLKTEVDSLKTKIEKVTNSLENLRKDMIVVVNIFQLPAVH